MFIYFYLFKLDPFKFQYTVNGDQSFISDLCSLVYLWFFVLIEFPSSVVPHIENINNLVVYVNFINFNIFYI